MYVIFLYVERAYRPGVRFTDAADFLFEKRCNPTSEDMFPIFGTPDKMVSQLVGDVFGVLRIHTRQYDMCSNSCEVPERAALPLDES